MICENQRAGVIGTTDQSTSRLLYLEHRRGKHIMSPSLVIAFRTLARERIGRLHEGELRDNDAFQGCTRGIEPFPEAFQREQRQVLISKEVIAQTLHRHAPLLAHQAQIIAFQFRLNIVEATLHLATVRK